MKLDDLKNKPTLINKNLRISGPPGANPGTGGITVQTRVVSPNSDVVHSETIKQIPNAVVPACATIGAATGHEQPILVSGTGEPNCYWLPWAEGRVYLGQLGNKYEYFFTPRMNGCGVIIGGTAAQPFVAHANLESDRLNDALARVIGLGLGKEAEEEATAAEHALIYEQFYGNLAAKLIQNGLLSGARLKVLTPQEYLIDAKAGFAAVFGINKGGAWKFYGNWGRRTRLIWEG